MKKHPGRKINEETVLSPNEHFLYSYDVETLKHDKLTKIYIGARTFSVIELLGQGKDGKTYFVEDDEKKTYILKHQPGYGRLYYHRTEAIQHNLKKVGLTDDPFFNSMFNFPDIMMCGLRNEVLIYPLDKPYKKLKPKEAHKEWINALVDVAKLQELTLSYFKLAIWDLGFASGLNYMLAPNGQTKWVDYGGNAFALYSQNKLLDKWRKFEERNKLAEVKKKPCLGELNSTMLRWYFLLHLEYHLTDVEDLHQRNFIEGIAIVLQVSNQFFKMFETADDTLFKSKICKDVIAKTKNLDWTKPSTWQEIQTTLKEYNEK